MVCGDEGLNDWCPVRKSQRICWERRGKTSLVTNVCVCSSTGCGSFPEPSHSLSSLPPDPCLKELTPLLIQLKWSYLSHPDISVISVVGWDTWVKLQRATVEDAASFYQASGGKCSIHFKLHFFFVPSFNWQLAKPQSLCSSDEEMVPQHRGPA